MARDFKMKKTDQLTHNIGETTEVSWRGSDDMTYEEWHAIGATFQQINRSLNWWIGDWLNQGEMKFGEAALQAIESTGRTLESLMKYKQVSQRIPPEIRNKDLSWSHHFAVAWMETVEERTFWLEFAWKTQLFAQDLREIGKLSPEQREKLRSLIDEAMRPYDVMKITAKIREDGRKELPPDSADILIETKKAYEAREGSLEKYIETIKPIDARVVSSLHREEVLSYFQAYNVPIKGVYENFVQFDSMTVTAIVDSNGKPRLLWESNWNVQ